MFWLKGQGRLIHTLHGHTSSIWTIAWHPSEARVASAGQSGRIRIWDTQSGQQIAVLHGQGGPVGTLAWSPDGRILYSSGGEDGIIRQWDASSAYKSENKP